MASVRTDGSLPPCIPAWTVERNNGDPVANEQDIPLPFQPLVVCLRFVGVELNPAILKESSKCYRYLFLSLGLFLILLNGFCIIYIAILTINEIVGGKNETTFLSPIDGDYSPITNSSTMSWNLVMDYVSYGSLTVGVHTCLFLLSRHPKWKLLWDNVQQIFQQFEDLKKTIRRVAVAGLFIIFSVFHMSSSIKAQIKRILSLLGSVDIYRPVPWLGGTGKE